LLALAALPAGAQDGITLAYDPDNAIIWHGESGEWDGQYTDPGAAIHYEGQFHMFRNGFVGWPAWAGAAYHTSPDGITWTEHGDGPVFSTDDVPFAEVGALVTSVLVEDDGTWVLYFYTVGNFPASNPSDFAIGRATAPDPMGPWTIHPEAVLLPGSEGAWDAGQVTAPSVVRTEDGYVMYYGGSEPNGIPLIGMATSADGITWAKYDDPATTEAPFAESDPIFVTGEAGAWDAALVLQPSVVVTPDGWVLSYKSMAMMGSPRDQAYGLATSPDGLHWTRYAENPILQHKEVQRRNLYFHELVVAEGQFILFFEMTRGYQNQTDIYAAMIEGSPF
jgi:hypothetical protein